MNDLEELERILSLLQNQDATMDLLEEQSREIREKTAQIQKLETQIGQLESQIRQLKTQINTLTMLII